MGKVYAQLYLYHEKTQQFWCARLESIAPAEDILYAQWGPAFAPGKHATAHYSHFVDAMNALENKKQDLLADGFQIVMQDEYRADIGQRYGFPDLSLGQPSLVLHCPSCGASVHILGGTCPACGTNLLDKTSSQKGHRAPGRPPLQKQVSSLLGGRYEIQEVIGKGGFGKVYKARDTRLANRIVAIKEVRSDQFATAEERSLAIAGFEQEMQLLVKLDHPHLPTIYDYWSEPDVSYLVMSYIAGKSLQECLDQKEHLEFYPLAYALCDVLTYLHTQTPPIIFRDLKPSNVMLDTSGRMYLIDFGIARFFKEGQKKDTQAIGSPGFAAPEQYGKAQTNARSDIYSLGATLYYLLTKDDPADHPFQFEALPPDASAGLQHLIIQKMLAMKPTDRPETVSDVSKKLRECEHAKPLAKPLAVKPLRKPVVASRQIALVSQLLLDDAYANQEEREIIRGLRTYLQRDVFPLLSVPIVLLDSTPALADRVQHMQEVCRDADALLVVVTKKFYTSKWGKWAYDTAQYAAQTYQKPLFALRIEDPGFSFKKDPFWKEQGSSPFIRDIADEEERALAYHHLMISVQAFLTSLF